MSERFGGVTIFPSVLGCWVDEWHGGKLVCEENVLITSIIDSESVSDFNRVVEEDRKFMADLGREAGRTFGQAVIMETQGKKEMEFFRGVYRKTLPKSMLKRAGNVFRKLI